MGGVFVGCPCEHLLAASCVFSFLVTNSHVPWVELIAVPKRALLCPSFLQDQCPTVSCFVRFWRELHGEKGGAAKGRKAKNQAQESLSTPNRTQGQGQVLTGKTAAARPGVAAAASAGVAEGTATGAGEEPGTGASVGEGEADGREGEGESEEAQELDDASLKLLAAHLLQGSTRTGSGSAGGAVSGKERAGAKAGASGTSQQQGSGPKETMSYAALAKAGRSSRLAYLGPPLDPSQTFEDVLARFSPQHHLNNVQIRYTISSMLYLWLLIAPTVQSVDCACLYGVVLPARIMVGSGM